MEISVFERTATKYTLWNKLYSKARRKLNIKAKQIQSDCACAFLLRAIKVSTNSSPVHHFGVESSDGGACCVLAHLENITVFVKGSQAETDFSRFQLCVLFYYVLSCFVTVALSTWWCHDGVRSVNIWIEKKKKKSTRVWEWIWLCIWLHKPTSEDY